MAYLSNYKWDVFISYAHADNNSTGPSSQWISAFYKRLVEELGKGLDGHAALFYDKVQQKSYNTIESILQEVKDSALFLVLGSPNWIRSHDWCVKEMETFLGHRPDTTRVFIAEFDPPRHELAFPKTLPNNCHVRFYTKVGERGLPRLMRSGEDPYEEMLQTLVYEMRERMIGLKSENLTVAPRSPSGRTGAFKNAVFVATSTDDVGGEREEVVNYLSGLGVNVLQLESPPAGREAYDAALGALLDEAGGYVQLLGRRKCPVPPGFGQSPTDIQLAAAEARKLDLFLWLPEDIDPARNSDEKYREILARARNGSAVPELATAVMEKLQLRLKEAERPNALQRSNKIKLVVNADPEDEERARELILACKSDKVKNLVGRAYLDDFDINDVAREHWLDANAVAYVQGKVERKWVNARMNAFNRERVTKGLEEDLRGEAVIYAPPPSKGTGYFSGSNLEEIDLSKDWSIDQFIAWLEKIGDAEAA